MGNIYSTLFLGISLLSLIKVHFSNGMIAETESVTLTTANPSSSLAKVSLADGYNNIISTDGTQWRCTQDGYSLCTYLTISDDCDYISTIRIGIYGGKITGNVDLFSLFSFTDLIDGNDKYFTLLNDWDGSLNDGNGNFGGLFMAPKCKNVDNTFFTVSTSNGNSIFNVLDDRDASAEASSKFIRHAPAGGNDDNYELLTDIKIKETKPLFMTLVNDRFNDVTTIYFESQTVTVPVSCSLKGSFPIGTDNILVNFFSDQIDSIVGFDKFEIDYTCESPPTPQPTSAPTPSCEYTDKCTVWGDPHINTWDGTVYHFMGEGYFDYVKSCDDSVARLPFTISARHDKCLNARTCVSEVIVSLSDGKIISFPDRGFPVFKDSQTNAVGSDTFIDSVTGELVRYTVKKTFFEIYFHYNENDIAMLKFDYKGRNLNLETSDCLFGDLNICGLCGNINDDENDDFTDCQTLNIIDNSDSSLAKSRFFGQAWINAHLFGESCCNANLDSMYLTESDCLDTLAPPPECDPTCMALANDICQEAYDEYCYDCNENSLSKLSMSEWMDSCKFDFCSNDVCSEKVLDGEYSMKEASNDGCLDLSVSACISEKYGNDLLSELFGDV